MHVPLSFLPKCVTTVHKSHVSYTQLLNPAILTNMEAYASFGGDVMDRVTTCLRVAIQVISILDTFFIQLSIVKV